GRMAGNALKLSYAEHGEPGPESAVLCQDTEGTTTAVSLAPGVKAPPPMWGEHLGTRTTGLHPILRIDLYEGIEHGATDHEHAQATILTTPWLADSLLVDTKQVELAMRVGPTGLPQEVPLTNGQQIEVEGVYISAAAASQVSPDGGREAVIHYTHAECGY